MKSKLSRWCVGSLALTLLPLTQAAISPGAAAQGGEPQYFAIRGARVVSVAGPVMEDATVVVARGVILAVGGKDVPIPADALVIDGKGLTVYPGLFDALTDVGIPPATPAPGESGGSRGGGGGQPPSRGPEDRPGATPWRSGADEASLSDKRIESWRNAGFTTVVSAPKGGFFPGQAAVLDLAGERNGDLVVKAPVALPLNLNPSGGFGSGFPDSKMGVLGYVHQVWLDVDWSTKAEATYEKNPRGTARPRYDRVNSALADALEDHPVVLIPANSSLELRRALVLTDRWKFPESKISAAIVGGQMAYEVSDELAAKKLPVIVNVKWPEPEKDSDPDRVPSLRELRFRDRAPSSPAALAKAGVRFAFSSDGITSPAEILKAVKKSVDAGLAPDAAIRALTLSPAEIFGVADRTGSIEKGKIANLIVTDGDLFGEKTKIKMIFVDGKRFEIREPERPKDPPKGDLTGKWTLKYTTPEGDEESTVELTMSSDGTLSGTVASHRGTANIISGYASADKFNFVINMVIEGSPADVNFSGTFEKNTMKGTISVLSYSIDFTGTRPGAASVSIGGAQ
jgi:Amidohydrolase family